MSLLMDALKKAEKAKQDADQTDSPAESADADVKASGSMAENSGAGTDAIADYKPEKVLSSDEGVNEQSSETQTEVPVDAQSISLEPRPDLEQNNLEQTIITPTEESKNEPAAAVAPVVSEPVSEPVPEPVPEPLVSEAAVAAPAPSVSSPAAPITNQDSPVLTLDDGRSTAVRSDDVNKVDGSHEKQKARTFFTEKNAKTGFAAPNLIVVGVAAVVVLLLGVGGYSYYHAVSSELQSDINRAMETVRRQQSLVDADQQVIAPAKEVVTKKSVEIVRPVTKSPVTKSPVAKSPVKMRVAAVKKPVVRQRAVAKKTEPVERQILPARKSPIKVKRQLVPDNIYALLSQAYSAYQLGDDNKALTYYTRVLEIEFNNRDALLGLAAISVRNRQFEKARDTYLSLIENNPRDSVALSGLLSIQSNVDPDKSETQIKLLLDKEPGSSHLLFTLGSLYATQQRWAEAQGAFFRAYSSENNNADFAYNLAVSLDQLEQRAAALRYYRVALELVKQSPVTFVVSDVMSRINVLQEALGG